MPTASCARFPFRPHANAYCLMRTSPLSSTCQCLLPHAHVSPFVHITPPHPSTSPRRCATPVMGEQAATGVRWSFSSPLPLPPCEWALCAHTGSTHVCGVQATGALCAPPWSTHARVVWAVGGGRTPGSTHAHVVRAVGGGCPGHWPHQQPQLRQQAPRLCHVQNPPLRRAATAAAERTAAAGAGGNLAPCTAANDSTAVGPAPCTDHRVNRCSAVCVCGSSCARSARVCMLACQQCVPDALE
eukprot:352213-Chlamydomonas_euryale.AAC.5